MYLCYGMHNMMNIVSGSEGDAQAVLIRCCEGYPGPGRLTKALRITRSLDGEDMLSCSELWLEDDGMKVNITPDKRVGIDYAEDADRNALLRFKLT